MDSGAQDRWRESSIGVNRTQACRKCFTTVQNRWVGSHEAVSVKTKYDFARER